MEPNLREPLPGMHDRKTQQHVMTKAAIRAQQAEGDVGAPQQECRDAT